MTIRIGEVYQYTSIFGSEEVIVRRIFTNGRADVCARAPSGNWFKHGFRVRVAQLGSVTEAHD